MPIEEQLATIFEVIEGGASTTAEVIQFPTDVAGASATLEGTTTEVMLGNGVATEVSQLTVVEGGATETAGVGLLAMDVGTVGMAIAPALGIIAGVGLYSLAPEFWTNVSNRLLDAGQTVGGKVRAFLNGETKQAGFSKETIEIFKQAFIEAGLYEDTIEYPEYQTSGNISVTSIMNGQTLISKALSLLDGTESTTYKTPLLNWINEKPNNAYYVSLSKNFTVNHEGVICRIFRCYDRVIVGYAGSLNSMDSRACFEIFGRNTGGSEEWGYSYRITYPSVTAWLGYFEQQLSNSLAVYMSSLNATSDNPNTQEGAIYPTEDPISTTYPTWTPWTLPEGLPEIYPIELPVVNPDATQETAQTPDELPDNDSLLEWLLDNFPQPAPNPDPYPQPVPNPDPDPQPEPDPIPEPEPEPTDENPVDPNPSPTPSPILPIPTLPDTVPANAMFTVYAPTISQVNSFGGWLWDSNILEQIKRIWQDPLNGIITFMKVYATPTTGGSDTIKVGVLDSGVSSAVVTSQFVTIECGSINIAEKFYNATDYTPFVSLHLYLPFIGIVELDTDEFMNGIITVTYHVDVYTGTCLAEVKSTRSPDMPNPTIVYTFSGNASQQLPLTSAEFSGALSSLVSAVGGGLAIASGGGLGLLAGASGLAHAVSHEMVHVAHSGSLSANAGIMGSRTPYIIITRHRPYDANGYNTIWGYPSNKTIYLNNCTGLVRVKDMQLETGATRSENDEIMELLKNGVIM